MSTKDLRSTRVMPANYRSGVKGQTFGTCNRMFFWRTRQFGRYDGTAQSYGLATLVDFKGNVMLFQMRTFQIWVPKGRRTDGLCGNNNGKKDDLPSPYKDAGKVPKTLGTFLRKYNGRKHAMNCNAPLAIHVKRYNVHGKTNLLHYAYYANRFQTYHYNCPKPKKCSKKRLRLALKACARHAKGIKNTPRRCRDCIVDICATGQTKWAKKEMTAAQRLAAERVGADSERPAKKGCFEIGAKYHDSLSGKYWIVGPSGKPKRAECKCKPTKRRLDGSVRSNKVLMTYRGMNLFKIKVNNVPNAASIRNACQKKQMKPVCDNASVRLPHAAHLLSLLCSRVGFVQYKDGRCWTNCRRMHFSYPGHDRMMVRASE